MRTSVIPVLQNWNMLHSEKGGKSIEAAIMEKWKEAIESFKRRKFKT